MSEKELLERLIRIIETYEQAMMEDDFELAYQLYHKMIELKNEITSERVAH